MLIQYRIRYEKGELVITQRVERGRSTAASEAAKTTKAAEAPAASETAPAAPAGALDANSLGASATGKPIPPVFAPSASGLIVIMGPVIFACDALEGGGGEGSDIGTDNTP
jgi:hypothetical protein